MSSGGGTVINYIFAVFPNSCSLSLAAFSDKKEWESKIQFWDNVYGKTYTIVLLCPCEYEYYRAGFHMSCMRDEILNEAAVDLVDRFSVVSSSDTFKVIKFVFMEYNNIVHHSFVEI